MNHKTKKCLAVAGGLAVCAVLVVLIGRQIQKEKPVDAPIPILSTEDSSVTVDTGNTEKEITVEKPDIIARETTDSGAVSTGTEQAIQGDAEKPQEQEKPENPKTEDGRDRTPSEDKNHSFTPEKPDTPPTYKQEDTQKKPEEKKPSGNNSIPGFDNVPDLGANQGEVVDGDGDINKQVGTMD